MRTQTSTSENNAMLNTKKQLLLLTLLGVFLFSSQSTFAQTEPIKSAPEKSVLVKGTVSDLDGPLFGINIVLKDTSIGMITDENGAFTFSKDVQVGDVLVFSYLGYKNQEIIVTEATRYLDINLEIDALTTVYIASNNDQPYSTKRIN